MAGAVGRSEHGLFGGDLLVSDVCVDGLVDGVHYWNRLGAGISIDLTRDQFVPGEVVLEPRTVPHPFLPEPARARAAYFLLRDRVMTALSRSTDRGRVVPDADPPTVWQARDRSPRMAR